MKKIKIIFPLLFIVTIAFMFGVTGCNDDNVSPIVTPPLNTGSADFTRYVAIGNSLTAGFSSNALSERDQVNGFANLLAKQVNTSFEIPLIKNPGIGGRLKLVSLSGPVIVPEPSVAPDPSSNLNINLPKPYNNLGIPGAIVFDMTDTTDFTAKSVARKNPFFALVLRNQAFGKSVVQQAINSQPTFMTIWIGNNDVLGYATSGGTRGTNVGLAAPPQTLPTEVPVFASLFKAMMDALSTTNAKAAVGNIPDVTSIPFFTTIGPTLSQKVPWGVIKALGAPGLFYQKHGETIASGVADSSALLTGKVLFTLVGSSYAGLVGVPTGKFYRDNNFPGLPAGIDTTKPFAVHPQNPWPDALTLDADEMIIAQTAVNDFNNVIASEANARGYALVDFNAVLKNIKAQGGLNVVGIGTFTADFITGGVFSYDGVHLTARGNGIVANEWIKAINAKFGASIPQVDLASLPPQPIGKISAGADIIYSPDAFDFMLKIFTGSHL